MKTAVISVLTWLAISLAYNVTASGNRLSAWVVEDYQGLAHSTILLGLPLLVVVPIIFVPLLRRFQRHIGDRPTRFWLMPLFGLIVGIPLGLWPIAALGGSFGRVASGAPGAFWSLGRELQSPEARVFYSLYGLFGTAIGFWYAIKEPGPAGEARA